MSVSLGINPITWTNDDMPELGGDMPLDVCLAETRHAGYAGIELGGKFPGEPSALRPILGSMASRSCPAGTARNFAGAPRATRSRRSPHLRVAGGNGLQR